MKSIGFVSSMARRVSYIYIELLDACRLEVVNSNAVGSKLGRFAH